RNPRIPARTWPERLHRGSQRGNAIPLGGGPSCSADPASPTRAETVAREAQAAARILRLEIQVLNASTDGELDTVFEKISLLPLGGLVIGADAFFAARAKQLGMLAARYRLPTVFVYRDFALAGGLASYGSNTSDMFREVGIYSGRILKGDK